MYKLIVQKVFKKEEIKISLSWNITGIANSFPMIILLLKLIQLRIILKAIFMPHRKFDYQFKPSTCLAISKVYTVLYINLVMFI